MDNLFCVPASTDQFQLSDCKEALEKLNPSQSSVSGKTETKRSSSENQLRILYLLGRENRLCPCQIHDALDGNKTEVIKNLDYLEERGFVECIREEHTNYYSISPDKAEPLWAVLKQMEHFDIREFRLL